MDWIMLFVAFTFGAMTMFAMFCLGYTAKIKEPMNVNRVHFYVARDKDGVLSLYLGKPNRRSGCIFSDFFAEGIKRLAYDSELRWYGLNEHDYDSLKWEDEPAEVFLNMEK